MSNKPVVVYGASGYTGRLVCEFLREYQIPFVAAGRNKERIEEAMAKVPGIETAEYEIVEVEHDADALTGVLKDAEVLCNTVGPFLYYGEVAVQAALKSGTHYIDTTGEQAWMLDMKNKYGSKFADAGLVLAPSSAYMYSPLDIAANIVLETEGIDTLEGACIANGIPTYGSTQTIFSIFQSDHLYLENNQFVQWEKAKGWEVSAPGKMMTQLAHPWGGGSLPLWFADDCRVNNCKQLTAFTNRPMFEQVIELQKHYEENIKDLPDDKQKEELAKISDSIQPGMPPRENFLIHRNLDFVIGRGTAIQKTCVIRTYPAYILTGVVQATIANKLLKSGPDNVGFVSPTQAVGHRYLLGQIKNFGPVEVDIF